MRRALLLLAMGAAGCTVTDDSVPLSGIWEMDTSVTRYLASEPRIGEQITCSQRGKRVRCMIVSGREDGTVYATQFEAELGGPRAFVKGPSDVQEVQLSYEEEPILTASFYNRNRLVYTWRARRSANGDSLFIDRVDYLARAQRESRTLYHRIRRNPASR